MDTGKITRKKPYKACKPIDTIAKTRNILSELSIFLKEEHFPHENFSACSLVVASNEIGNIDIRTNGKGMSIQYSLASAYSEFIERIQNYFLFNHLGHALKKNINLLSEGNSFRQRVEKDNLILDFLYDPFESYQKTDDVIDECYSILAPIFKISDKQKLLEFVKNDLGFQKVLCVPFYAVSEERSINLPIELIFAASGSNGMCAGNTPQEAIIQGICEIMERYAGTKIYYDRLTPPTIPKEYFEGTLIHKYIEEIEEKRGLKIIIKDCSLGLGLPVMGVIIINPKDNTYNFNLGSDPSPITALERCLTELYQSLGGVYYNPIETDNDFINSEINGISIEDKDYLNCQKIFINGTEFKA